MSDMAFVVVVPPGRSAAPGVDAQRLPDLGFWDTSAVHGWLQAFEADEGERALVRVVSAADEDLIPADAPRLEVPVTRPEAERIAQVAAAPAAAEAQAELMAFRRVLAERPAMVGRARAAGLNPGRIDQLAGAPVTASDDTA